MPRVVPHGSGGHRFWWRYGGELGQTFEVLAVSGAGIIATTLVWYAVVVLALTHSRVRVHYQNFRHWLDRLAGAVLALFGIRLITAE